ncbi:MAG TPA: tRNA-binding protein [Actinomycetota bacterium]|jgi:tRNA-binding protein|nr:tRNA-binding protein [Actinomycetota bacterium]
MPIDYADFDRVDMRAGLVTAVEEFPRARTPSYKVQVDFGSDLGVRWSSAQAKHDYRTDELVGRQLLAVVNLHPKNIAGFTSEVLLLGVPAEDGGLSLLVPSRPARLGGRVY